MLDGIAKINQAKKAESGDPEIDARIAQYEMAYRMQTSVPELTDLSKESKGTLSLYGANPGKPSFANNCLLARRLVERGVRFVQLYDRGWDSHTHIEREHKRQCGAADRPITALLKDLKQRGLLEDTLVVWCGEFGRTPDNGLRGGVSYGRDHNAKAMTMWFAGGCTQAGHTIGATDEIGAEAVECVHHIRDVHVTWLNLLGLDDNKLTYYHAGRHKQLSQFGGKVIQELIA
jgi:membrane-anchored protein YejM (alkaline phosphatase superfamily)